MFLLLPPVVLSERPHVLTAKFRLLKNEPWAFSAWATEGIVIPETKFWRIPQTLLTDRLHEISHYYLGRHRFVVLNDEIVRVDELTGEVADERNLYLSMENVALEDLIFRSLEAQEVPERLREPAVLIAKMSVKLDQKEGGAPLFYARKDGDKKKFVSFSFSFDKGIPRELKDVLSLSCLKWIPGKDGHPGGVTLDTRKQPYFLLPFVLPENGFIWRTKYRILDKNNWTFRLAIGQGLYAPDIRFWLKFKEKSAVRSNLDYYFYGRYGVTVSEGQVTRIELRDKDLLAPRLFLGPANVVLEELEVIGKDSADFPPELEPEALIKKMGVVLDNKTEGYHVFGRFAY
jgi:hypothetical protein